jgi:peptidyl-prolyl cis-trans isomerase SurA
MKNLNYFFKYIIPFLLFYFNNSVFAIENKIIANVGNNIISSYEIKNKVKTILFLTKQEINQKNVNQAKSIALRTLINMNLKKEEVEKFQIEITRNKNVDNYLKRISSTFQVNELGLKQIFNDSKLDYDLYLNEIMIEMAWQKLIFRLFNNKINLNEKEIDGELKEIIKSRKNIKEYKLSEIVIIMDENVEEKIKIKEIKDQINIDGFENTAVKFSSSSSALEGGSLGWISSKSLSNKILKIVQNLKTGDISEPYYQSNNMVFLKLIDIKNLSIDSSNLEKIRSDIIRSKRNELLNLFSNSHLSKIKNNSLIQVK